MKDEELGMWRRKREPLRRTKSASGWNSWGNSEVKYKAIGETTTSV